MQQLYRFRSIDALLDGYHELANQEIFCSDPHSLNDPMEGLRDTFWSGDEIVWKNLFKHYLRCLDRAYGLLWMMGENLSFGWDHIPIMHLEKVSLSPAQDEIHEDIFNQFFDEPLFNSYIERLARRRQPIRRNELSAQFQSLHPYAIQVLSKCYVRRNLIPEQPAVGLSPNSLQDMLKNLGEVVTMVDQLQPDMSQEAAARIDTFYALRSHANDQLNMLHLYNKTINPTLTNKNFVLMHFPTEYVLKLENLIHPPWYAACFAKDCRNSSLWGTYGNGHTGVCLIFKAEERDARLLIRVDQAVGLNKDGNIIGEVDQEFLPIHYARQLVAIDFFKFLPGRLPIPNLNKYWYLNADGRRSSCAEFCFEHMDEWRAQYHNDFQKSITTKLDDWSYENEYRIVLRTELDLSDEKWRKLKYRFNDLSGIIFGIRTPLEKKLEIMKIIDEKCTKFSRLDFKFYQAYYAAITGTIEHNELGLLKFQAPKPPLDPN